MWGYHRRLIERELDRWVGSGWVSAEGAANIRADLAKSGGIGLAGVLGILASVLLAFAAMSFVAAHWDEIPRLARLLLLVCGLVWGGYAAAGYFHNKGMPAFTDAAILFASAAFGASIMLISQMYHIQGDPPDGVLMWWAGTLAGGVLLRSNPTLALTLILVCVWSGLVMSEHNGPHWPFLIGWGLVSAAFVWQRWYPGVHLSGLALSIFVFSLGLTLQHGHAHALVTGLGLLAAAGAIAAERTSPEWNALARPALGYGAATAFAGLMMLQFFERAAPGELALLAAFTLAFLLALIWYGLTHDERGALWLGYIGFSIEILSLYAKTVGTLLDTSLFFLIAGLIFAALAFVAYRLLGRRGSEAGA